MERLNALDAEFLLLEDGISHMHIGAVCVFADPPPSYEDIAGMIAANVLRGDAELAPWADLGSTHAFLLDVREPHEFHAGSIPGSVNIPLGQLRTRISELPQSAEIWVSCGVGQRAYYACRILAQHGLHAHNLSGGYSTYRVLHPGKEQQTDTHFDTGSLASTGSPAQ